MSPTQRSAIREYYEAYWSEDGYNPEQKVTKSVLEVLQRCVGPTDDCIDVGCGRGAGPSQWLNAHAGSYLGVDISRRAIEAARTEGLNVAEISDASELPCQDCSLDVAVSLEVFQNLFAPQLAAQEIWRVLRPRGD
jgi:ubiquinone/menaquinone biosynthesis C-methylase UbiE